MNLQLAGDSACIVGGASGVGRAIATAFAQEGAQVVLLDRNDQVSETAQQLARETGNSVRGHVCDAADYDAVRRAAAEVGQVEHIVYAAGCGSGKFGFPFWNLEPDDWDRVWRVNLLGAVHVAHAFAPRLAEAQRGTLLLISSVAGQIGSQTDPPYSAAKAALINFAQVAAKDLAPHNVRVNTICPGMVKTPLNRAVWQAWNERQEPSQQRSYEDWAGEKIQKLTPLGRWQEPQDIAALAVFLASDQARNITGQTMNVDGGWVMHW
jgi:NAD(P)-dependent dehydrogenase (short-subunit alcohol dehydrogenase family)